MFEMGEGGGRLALCDPPLSAKPQLEGRCPAREDQISRDTACARVPQRSVERPQQMNLHRTHNRGVRPPCVTETVKNEQKAA